MNFTIGPRNWVIEEVTLDWFQKNVDSSDVHGWTCEETATIYIVIPKKGWKDPLFKDLIQKHEIIHAMLYGLGITDHNEQLIDGLAHMWLQYEQTVVVNDEPKQVL